MPPQGESVGLALEDVILFSKLLEQNESKSVTDIVKQYEELRKERIHAAVDEANFRWETIRDRGWLGGIMMEWLTVIFIWWSKEERKKSYEYDVRDLKLAD